MSQSKILILVLIFTFFSCAHSDNEQAEVAENEAVESQLKEDQTETFNVALDDPRESCMERAQRWNAGSIDNVDTGSTQAVNFGFDSYEISDESLKKLISIKQQTGDKNAIGLVGYTDSIGNKEYNHTLAKRRVKSVERCLKSLGLKSNFKEQEMGASDTNDSYAKNRRVDINIY